MIYFDTDILVHYKVAQDKSKADFCISLVNEHIRKKLFYISLLSVQEACFVYSKLKLDKKEISSTIDYFLQFECPSYTKPHFLRALEIANFAGTKNINDCIHTALAETYCSELYTFNKNDFSKIQQYTDLKITIF